MHSSFGISRFKARPISFSPVASRKFQGRRPSTIISSYRPTPHPSLAYRAAEKKRAVRKGPIPLGTIQEIQGESPYWDHSVGKLLEASGAKSYGALQRGTTLKVEDNHPEKALPVYYSKNGRDCDAHSGKVKYYVILEWRDPGSSSAKPKELVVGLECAANIRWLRAKMANSQKVIKATEKLQEIEDVVAQLELDKKNGKPVKENLAAAIVELRAARATLTEKWREDQRDRSSAYNAQAFLKEAPGLRELLFSLEQRLGWILENDRRDLLVIKDFAKDLRDIESFAEGVRIRAAFLKKHLVQKAKEIYRALAQDSNALRLWPSFDMAMRTFERYVNMEGTIANAEDLYNQTELDFIRSSIQKWNQEIKAGAVETFEATDIIRLRKLYDRFSRRGFESRQTVLSREPRLEEFLRIVKEDLHTLPAELRSEKGFLGEMLSAWSPREVLIRRVIVEKEPRPPREPDEATGGRPKAVTGEDATFMRIRRAFKQGEKIGRFRAFEIDRFVELTKILEKNYRTREEILEEFPDIQEWIRDLKAEAPSFRKGEVPKSVGKLLAGDLRWRSIARKITLWEEGTKGERFARHWAQTFKEILDLKNTKGLQYKQLEGCPAMVDRLQFRKNQRGRWVDFIAYNAKALGEKITTAFKEIKALAQSKKESLTMVEAEALRRFDDVLAAELTTLEDLKKQSERYRATLDALCERKNGPGEPFSDEEGRRIKFLYDRGYVEPGVIQRIADLNFIHLDQASGKPHATLVERAKAGLANIAKGEIPLNDRTQYRVTTAITRLETHRVCSPEDVRLLKDVANPIPWFLFRDHMFNALPLLLGRPWDVKAPGYLKQILASAKTDRARIQFARQVEQEMAGFHNPENGLDILMIIRENLDDPNGLHLSAKTIPLLDVLLDKMPFGFHREVLPNTRRSNLQKIERIALLSPNHLQFRKTLVWKKYLQALGDVYQKGGREGPWDESIRKEAIASMGRLLEADRQTWEPILRMGLTYGATDYREGQGWRRVQVGSQQALEALNLN